MESGDKEPRPGARVFTVQGNCKCTNAVFPHLGSHEGKPIINMFAKEYASGIIAFIIPQVESYRYCTMVPGALENYKRQYGCLSRCMHTATQHQHIQRNLIRFRTSQVWRDRRVGCSHNVWTAVAHASQVYSFSDLTLTNDMRTHCHCHWTRVQLWAHAHLACLGYPAIKVFLWLNTCGTIALT